MVVEELKRPCAMNRVRPVEELYFSPVTDADIVIRLAYVSLFKG
jgi:hypothetical protein